MKKRIKNRETKNKKRKIKNRKLCEKNGDKEQENERN